MSRKERIDESERKTQNENAVADYDGEASNRAKLVEVYGDDFVETEAAPETVDSRFANFWYHYKWHTIIGLVVLAFLFIGITQLRTNDPADAMSLYAGEGNINEYAESISKALGEMLTTDANGNGKKRVVFEPFTVISQKKLDEEEKALPYGQNIYDIYDLKLNEQNYQGFKDRVFQGECGVMFLSPDLYEEAREEGALIPLADVLDEVPASAADEYALKLCECDFYKYYSAFQSMPEDTVVCLRNYSDVQGLFVFKKAGKMTLEKNKSFFRDLVSFTLPEGFSE